MIRNGRSGSFSSDEYVRPLQPLLESLAPSAHVSHLSPAMPGLQAQRPLVCSQSARTEPRGLQLQAGSGREEVLLTFEGTQLLTMSIICQEG